MIQAELMREFLVNWTNSGKEELSAKVKPSSADPKNRTVDVIWYSGSDIQRFNYLSGEPYLLRFDPRGADLSLLNSCAPICDNHFSLSVEDQKGRVDRAWFESGKYFGTLRFSQRPAVDGVWMDVATGILTKFSMGTEILDSEDLKGTDQPVRLAKKWRPYEISVCAIPADFGTQTLSQRRPPSSLQAMERELERLRGDSLPTWKADHLRRQREIDILRLR